MNDIIQHSLEALAIQNPLARKLAVFCALALVFVMGAGWLLSLLADRGRITPATLVRLVTLVVLALVGAKVMQHLVIDPRPYLVDHTAPLTSVSQDNGFPSDHVLLAAALTFGLCWVNRRLLPLFAVGTLLVMAGRLAVGAHHSLDVFGSLAIVAVAALIAGALPLPASWNAPLLASRPTKSSPSSAEGVARPAPRRTEA